MVSDSCRNGKSYRADDNACVIAGSPFIIGTMDQATCSSTNLQLHHNFRWVLCANHMEPVLGLLGRYLRRRLVSAQLTTDDDDLRLTSGMDSIVSWLADVWRHLNRLLETHNSHDVTIGAYRPFQHRDGHGSGRPVDRVGSRVRFKANLAGQHARIASRL